jgi:hypothetical protein
VLDTCFPKHLHELALKRIGHYLKQTSDHGMVMNVSSDVCKIDAYPDADFSGMYGHEEHTDPACAKSCTGFCVMAIKIANRDSPINDGSRDYSSISLLQGAVSNH